MEAKTEKDKMIHPAGYMYRCIVCMRVIWCAFNIKITQHKQAHIAVLE